MEQIFQNFLDAISPALQTLIAALVTLLLGQASLYVQRKYEALKANASSDQRYFLDFLVNRAVESVEQLYADNETKKEEAIKIVEAALKNYGLTVDVDVIADAIESAVFVNKKVERSFAQG